MVSNGVSEKRVLIIGQPTDLVVSNVKRELLQKFDVEWDSDRCNLSNFINNNLVEAILICAPISAEAGLDICLDIRLNSASVFTPIIFLLDNFKTSDWLECLALGGIEIFRRSDAAELIVQKIVGVCNYKRLFYANGNLSDVIIAPVCGAPILTRTDKLFLEKVEGYIDRNLSNTTYSITDLAHSLGISTNLLYRKIKRVTGKTATRFVCEQRLKRAAKLIKSSQHPIYYIVIKAGFSSSSYFSRCFKRTFGCSPSKYRRIA